MNTMKKTLFLLAVLLSACHALAQTMEEAFKTAEQIVQNIKKTQFPDRTFRITDFGAVAGNPEKLNHEAI